MYGRTFVLGDVHGAYKALIEVLEQSQFDYERDTLISLGDVCDGWPETKQCFDELLKIKNLIYVFGNHDFWTLKWMKDGTIDKIWVRQGGQETLDSYSSIPELDHLSLLENANEYYLINNKLFVHGGIDPDVPLHNQTQKTFLWDRTLVTRAMAMQTSEPETKITHYDEIYVGHTPIHRFGYLNPTKACEVWLMDTGAGWDGVLSLMNIETKEFYTSDKIPNLYPGYMGRF